MAKSVHDDVLDGALNTVKNNATRITVCSTQPTTVTEAITTYKIAIKTISGTDFTGPVNGDTNGRKLTSNQHTAIPVDASSTALHVALVGISSSRLYYVTTCTSQFLTSGNTVTIPAWDMELGDPS